MPAPDTSADLAALGEVDRQGRVGRTAVQVGLPSSVVAIGTWLAGLLDLDLDPGPGTDMPATIVAAWIAVVTVLVARKMNPPADDPEADAGRVGLVEVGLFLVLLAVAWAIWTGRL